jgi:hypothetical protein
MARTWSAFGACAAFVLAALPVSAQNPQTKKQPELTLIGCVELEKDYRARMDAGKGGPLGSGVGTANEFILTFAKPAPTPASKASGGAVATAGTAGDYSLTGKLEPELTRYVGRQIEVVGVVETIDAHRSATEAKELPRLTINTWHPVGDFCPNK